MQAVADAAEVPEIRRKIWTREEAHLLVDLGLPNAEKWELIEGDLIDRMGKKRPHVIWQAKVHEWLRSVFGAERVESESPADVAVEDNTYSEPEADLKVLLRPSQDYSSNPQPKDILLVVEISDSTLRFDLKVKAALYARAEIIEYWVVSIPEKGLIVHREPKAGVYTSIISYRSDEAVAPIAAPDTLFCLDRL